MQNSMFIFYFCFQTTASSGPAFNTATPVFNFGQPKSESNSTSGLFTFGAKQDSKPAPTNPPALGGSAFGGAGNTGTSAPAPAFGAAPSTTPSFGAVQPTFGASTTAPAAAPSFGGNHVSPLSLSDLPSSTPEACSVLSVPLTSLSALVSSCPYPIPCSVALANSNIYDEPKDGQEFPEDSNLSSECCHQSRSSGSQFFSGISINSVESDEQDMKEKEAVTSCDAGSQTETLKKEEKAVQVDDAACILKKRKDVTSSLTDDSYQVKLESDFEEPKRAVNLPDVVLRQQPLSCGWLFVVQTSVARLGGTNVFTAMKGPIMASQVKVANQVLWNTHMPSSHGSSAMNTLASAGSVSRLNVGHLSTYTHATLPASVLNTTHFHSLQCPNPTLMLAISTANNSPKIVPYSSFHTPLFTIGSIDKKSTTTGLLTKTSTASHSTMSTFPQVTSSSIKPVFRFGSPDVHTVVKNSLSNNQTFSFRTSVPSSMGNCIQYSNSGFTFSSPKASQSVVSSSAPHISLAFGSQNASPMVTGSSKPNPVFVFGAQKPTTVIRTTVPSCTLTTSLTPGSRALGPIGTSPLVFRFGQSSAKPKHSGFMQNTSLFATRPNTASVSIPCNIGGSNAISSLLSSFRNGAPNPFSPHKDPVQSTEAMHISPGHQDMDISIPAGSATLKKFSQNLALFPKTRSDFSQGVSTPPPPFICSSPKPAMDSEPGSNANKITGFHFSLAKPVEQKDFQLNDIVMDESCDFHTKLKTMKESEVNKSMESTVTFAVNPDGQGSSTFTRQNSPLPIIKSILKAKTNEMVNAFSSATMDCRTCEDADSDYESLAAVSAVDPEKTASAIFGGRRSFGASSCNLAGSKSAAFHSKSFWALDSGGLTDSRKETAEEMTKQSAVAMPAEEKSSDMESSKRSGVFVFQGATTTTSSLVTFVPTMARMQSLQKNDKGAMSAFAGRSQSKPSSHKSSKNLSESSSRTSAVSRSSSDSDTTSVSASSSASTVSDSGSEHSVSSSSSTDSCEDDMEITKARECAALSAFSGKGNKNWNASIHDNVMCKESDDCCVTNVSMSVFPAPPVFHYLSLSCNASCFPLSVYTPVSCPGTANLSSYSTVFL